MKVEELIDIIGADFYTGVPDSQLKALCNYLVGTYGNNEKHHIIAANEGNAVALAAGYHLATGKVPVVYMQNSGEGNIVNPVASLLNEKVYNIPMIFIIGWRGKPGVPDEPQHLYQGEITLKLLEDMGIRAFVIEKDTTNSDLELVMKSFQKDLKIGKNVAFVITKDVLNYDGKVKYANKNTLNREEVIQHIVNVSGNDPIVSTTGKVSRELFEIREKANESHKYDFLTVGSMGHSSSIALGVAINVPNKKIWCIDGDGALLMHMGAIAIIGSVSPRNLVHIVINNGAHETVGGMPTVADNMDIIGIAKACGYKNTYTVNTLESLDEVLLRIKDTNELVMLEIKCAIASRNDLGRPTTTTIENKNNFMMHLLDTE